MKGMGIGAIIKLVLAVMVASLFISISTVGSIGQALSQSFEDIETVSGEKGVEIENTQNLAWLIALTRERALNRGCEVVQERNDPNEDGDGYPGLEGSYLTKYPPCFGGDAGIMRGIGGVYNPKGLGADEDFMTGIYSREKIEVTDNISFTPGEIKVGASNSDNEVEVKKLGAVFQGTPRSNADNVEIDRSDDDASIVVTAVGSAGAGAAVGTFTAGPIGTAGGAALGFLGGLIGAIWNNSENEQPNVAPPMLFFEKGDALDRSSIDRSEVNSGDLESIEGETFYLCEGDAGYVQANRGHLDEFGQSDKSPLIPIIVIDEVQYESCLGGGSDTGGDDYEPFEVDVRNIDVAEHYQSQYKQMRYWFNVVNGGQETETIHLRFKDSTGDYVGQHPANIHLGECTLEPGEESDEECSPFQATTIGNTAARGFNVVTPYEKYCTEIDNHEYASHLGVFEDGFTVEVWDSDDMEMIQVLYESDGSELPSCDNCGPASTPEQGADGNCT